MELNEFVRATLTQIISGVDKAREEHPDRIPAPAFSSREHGTPPHGTAYEAGINPLVFLVEFDVEVVAATTGGAKLSVGFASVGAGGSKSKESTQSNRIRFSVPIDYETQR